MAEITAKHAVPDVVIGSDMCGCICMYICVYAAVGADVILWPDYVRPLLLTVRWLLSYRAHTSACYISYVVRATATTVYAGWSNRFDFIMCGMCV